MTLEYESRRRAGIDYGSRARIGVIVPSINAVAEPDFHRLAPAGVECFATRLRLTRGDPQELAGMAAQAAGAAALLADMEPDVILFHCTAATMVADLERAARIAADIERASGRPAVVTSDAVIGALRALEAATVLLVAPYMPEVVEAETAFLAAHGIAVAKALPLALSSPEFVGVEPARWRELTLEAAAGEAVDAVFLSCANVRTLEVIEPLESELGKPVITSNQAAFWWALRAAGIEDALDGHGRLLRLAAPSITKATR